MPRISSPRCSTRAPSTYSISYVCMYVIMYVCMFIMYVYMYVGTVFQLGMLSGTRSSPRTTSCAGYVCMYVRICMYVKNMYVCMYVCGLAAKSLICRPARHGSANSACGNPPSPAPYRRAGPGGVRKCPC